MEKTDSPGNGKKAAIDAAQPPDNHHGTQEHITQNVFLFLIAFRVLNALCVRTFFQPDEYFQSLEPAWEIAFGKESGAWITWVRSAPRKLQTSIENRTL